MFFPIQFSNSLAFRTKAEAIHLTALRALDRLVASILATRAKTISGSRGAILPPRRPGQANGSPRRAAR
jgi:hypothetical protein